jgi:hypothetical protein
MGKAILDRQLNTITIQQGELTMAVKDMKIVADIFGSPEAIVKFMKIRTVLPKSGCQELKAYSFGSIDYDADDEGIKVTIKPAQLHVALNWLHRFLKANSIPYTRGKSGDAYTVILTSTQEHQERFSKLAVAAGLIQHSQYKGTWCLMPNS